MSLIIIYSNQHLKTHGFIYWIEPQKGKEEGTLQKGIWMASEGQCFDNDSVLL